MHPAHVPDARCGALSVSEIEALGFRSLRYVSQRLEPFHVLGGPNASGESPFLDVLAFLVIQPEMERTSRDTA